MRKHFFFVLFTLAIVACKTNPVQKIAQLEQQLIVLDKEFGGAKVVDKEKALAFIRISEELATLVQTTDPDKYASVLLKAAGLAKTIENPQKAIELYGKIANDMPQHAKAPTALFMLAFVYENDLSDLATAKTTYELFLERYPNDPDFVDDAQNSLKMLGKSPEEIIREFEKMQEKTQ